MHIFRRNISQINVVNLCTVFHIECHSWLCCHISDGKLRVFVATDVASRGIDVDDVDAVFNYDVPQENEYYVHRIGRTGRAKRHGVAYTLVADYPSKMRLDAIAKFTGNDVKPAHFEGDTLVVDAK